MTAKHREVEEHFRDLLAKNDLEPPDRVLYEPAAVGFVWEEPKVVVFVDFEPDGSTAEGESARARA